MKQTKTQLRSIAKLLAGIIEKIGKIEAMLGETAPAKKVKTVAKKSVKKKAVPVAKENKSAKEPVESKNARDTVLDRVLDVVRRSRNGATIAQLKGKTALESRQLSNALYKLSKKGKIKAKSRGVYIKA